MAKDLVRTRRYIQKFYQMKTQLQAVGLRIQVRNKLETGRGVAVVAVTEEGFVFHCWRRALDDVHFLTSPEEQDLILFFYFFESTV